MKPKFNIVTLLTISILFITVSSIGQWTDLPINSTFIWWGIYSFILLLFVSAKTKYYDVANDYNIIAVKLYLAWNIICILRGISVAENYWEWKFLVSTGMVLLLPTSIFITTNITLVQKILCHWFKYALPAFFVLLPFFKYGDALGRYLVPVSFILLFLPLVKTKWKIIMLALAGFVIVGALDARSNVIKFIVSFCFGLIYYIRNYIPVRLFESVRLSFLIFPFFFFTLAIAGNFNIFKLDEILGDNFTTTVVSDGVIQEENLAADTRTTLYEEVLASAIKYDYVLFGRTPARGNESTLFGDIVAEELATGKMERFSNEVSILNVFTWTGFIGVILYFFIFCKASYLAINRSNNVFIKILGLYVSFRWVYAWIEDFSEFDLSFFFLWIMIGMCFSKSFREMNNLEFKYWLLGIFHKNYRKKDIKIYDKTLANV